MTLLYRCDFGAAAAEDAFANGSFQIEAADGTYTVALVLGDDTDAAETTGKAGEGRMMVNKRRTVPGQFASVRFAVWVTDGLLKLTLGGAAPRIRTMEIHATPQICTLFLAGDSTVTDQPAAGYPYAGWGQMLPQFIQADAAVANYALSGRSSKSFIDEGHLEAIWRNIKPGDYLLIQFAHNDQKCDEARYTEPYTSYPQTLMRYVEGARRRQAYPILVTAVQRRFFDEDGTLRDTHGAYVPAMRELAAEAGVPLIDLAAKSKELFERLGPEGTKSVFMWLAPGEYANFADGTEDNTHFQEQGATQVAKLVSEGMKELCLQPLGLYLR